MAPHAGGHHGVPALRQEAVGGGRGPRGGAAGVAALRPRGGLGRRGLLPLPVPQGHHALPQRHQPGQAARRASGVCVSQVPAEYSCVCVCV